MLPEKLVLRSDYLRYSSPAIQSNAKLALISAGTDFWAHVVWDSFVKTHK
jgi:hypothetical protein